MGAKRKGKGQVPLKRDSPALEVASREDGQIGFKVNRQFLESPKRRYSATFFDIRVETGQVNLIFGDFFSFGSSKQLTSMITVKQPWDQFVNFVSSTEGGFLRSLEKHVREDGQPEGEYTVPAPDEFELAHFQGHMSMEASMCMAYQSGYVSSFEFYFIAPRDIYLHLQGLSGVPHPEEVVQVTLDTRLALAFLRMAYRIRDEAQN